MNTTIFKNEQMEITKCRSLKDLLAGNNYQKFAESIIIPFATILKWDGFPPHPTWWGKDSFTSPMNYNPLNGIGRIGKDTIITIREENEESLRY